jgi:hypothetical protein
MLKNVTMAVVTLFALTLAPAFAIPCQSLQFVGSYAYVVGPTLNPDLFGDGSNVNFDRTYLFQLNLHIDGTAEQVQTGAPDLFINGGTSTPEFGSWTCRTDGMLVLTLLLANATPTPDSLTGHSTLASNIIDPTVVATFRPDLFLSAHVRRTWLISITDANTLSVVQRRNRRYNMTQDPTDPNGGTLRPLLTDVLVYKRVKASDADLLLP